MACLLGPKTRQMKQIHKDAGLGRGTIHTMIFSKGNAQSVVRPIPIGAASMSRFAHREPMAGMAPPANAMAGGLERPPSTQALAHNAS